MSSSAWLAIPDPSTRRPLTVQSFCYDLAPPLLCYFLTAFPDPSTRRPLTVQSFCYDLAPPLLCYFLTAFLVLIPNTYPIRLALLPLSLYTAFRAATELDLGKGLVDEERFAFLSHGLLLAMTTLVMRVSIWTFQLAPYTRTPSNSKSTSASSLTLDALDLSFNLRGIRWCWSTGLKTPIETRPTTSTSSFLLHTLRSLIFNYVLFDFLLLAVQSFSGLDSPSGASIFDLSLPPVQRYARSTLISLLSGFVIYASINTVHLLLTLICISLLAHAPEDWPPAFHSPWLSTSLTTFWNLRWHQFFRHNFISFAGVPTNLLLGNRPAALLAVFLASGLLHHFGLWGMGRGSDFIVVVGFFIMMGVGILLEHAFKAVFTKRVQGFYGWLWVMFWVLGWANMLVDAWLSRGLAGSTFQPQHTRPSLFVVRFVRDNFGY